MILIENIKYSMQGHSLLVSALRKFAYYCRFASQALVATQSYRMQQA